ncbi:MAG TPA: HAD-IA family hydrolase [Candidatus Saccharibacteria bacterium]|nr:HAD-IA family hydrolase [Candidatus Saccharibacteria bacterium]HRJ91233.1 HAD-IA family hydrolase [Candidatus Saccharibacteria bacterium]
MPHKVLLLDIDGVLMQQPKLFSEIYCERYGVSIDKLLPFYSSKEFLDCSIGKYDLKQAIRDHRDKWQYTGDLDSLLSEWFEAERYPNEKLVELVKNLREQGVCVVIVTQQEKYRTAYLKQNVFSDMYDDFFVSCELGLHKDSKDFWDEVLKRLDVSLPGEVLYFDDKQSLVTLAKSVGIDAHLYQSVEQVKKLASI